MKQTTKKIEKLAINSYETGVTAQAYPATVAQLAEVKEKINEIIDHINKEGKQ